MPKPISKGGEKNLIARRLVQLRRLRGLSQRQLAARLQLEGYDMDKNVITRIETGKRYVTDIELAALCQALEVSSVGAVLTAVDLELLRVVGYAVFIVVVLHRRLYGLLGQHGAVYLLWGQTVQSLYHSLV